MFSVLIASALGAASTPVVPPNDPDVRCYAALTLAFVGLGESGKATALEITGLTSLIWFYYGRMESRFPGADLAGAIVEIVEHPEYLPNELQADAARCGAEAERKGSEMQALGKRIQRLAPLVNKKSS